MYTTWLRQMRHRFLVWRVCRAFRRLGVATRGAAATIERFVETWEGLGDED